MENLNDVLWADEDDDIITTYGVMTKACQINDDCSGGDGGFGDGVGTVCTGAFAQKVCTK